MKKKTIKQTIQKLSKKTLLKVALHFIEKSGTDPNGDNDGELCLDHVGECGVCINGVFISC